MQKEIGFIIRPPLPKSGKEAARHIREDYEALFLNLPKTIDHLVAEIPYGLEYEQLVEEIRRKKLLPEPVEAWLKDSKPILQRLKEIGGKILTYCYKDPSSFEHGVRTSHNIALLTIRGRIKNEIEVEKWLEQLRWEVEETKKALERERKTMEEEAENYDRSICVSWLEGRWLRNQLKEKFRTWIKYVDQPYLFTPLEVLRRKLAAKGEVSEEEARHLIKEHIRFIHDYVLTNELDEAYLKWTKEKLYWHSRFRGKNT
ncbi:MAG TPA: hypothetical protein EYH45_00675 [Candidatus Caldiarchaeum subterraneum]|uniref:Uncharacterized protein n=1 Tax=Caldiarchaeum subterraneum TaxID=311458 RepID=A0A833A2Q8_CALS0|nr:hypothetical protein [Candidatus Caldarchaeum subterraneum]